MVSYRRCGCSQLRRPHFIFFFVYYYYCCFRYSILYQTLKYAQKISIGLYVQSSLVISNVAQVAVVWIFREICQCFSQIEGRSLHMFPFYVLQLKLLIFVVCCN
jgi:hypothetical protein